MPTVHAKSVTELLGQPDPPKTGRNRLVAAAIELFYRHGFSAIGIDRVIAAAGVAKTTFYKHFESKDDLMVAAVRRRDEWESQAWGRAVRKLAGDDPTAQLLAMFDVMDLWFNDPEFHGCMFMNTAAEFPNPHDPVHQAAADHKRRDARPLSRPRPGRGRARAGGGRDVRRLLHRPDRGRANPPANPRPQRRRPRRPPRGRTARRPLSTPRSKPSADVITTEMIHDPESRDSP